MSDQEVFQSGQKQCIEQIVNPSTNSVINLAIRNKIRQNNHQWKFQKIKRITHFTDSPRKIETNNISFQTQQLIELSEQQQKDTDEQNRLSVFSNKYISNQQIYIKKSSIGTKFLGRRQYFASIFVDPSVIAKTDIFSLFRSPPVQLLKKQCYFHANFQSGNLLAAYKVNINQYDLILQNDINSKGNTQWFYFQIKNVPSKTKIRINIVNMLKSDSLFNYGMQPCIYSSEANRYNQQGWIRSGSSIKYFRNQNKVDCSNRYYYTLTFTISTAYQGDSLRISHCYPYTVSDLNNYLQQIQKKSGAKYIIKKCLIGTTIGKNNIQALHISEQNPRKKGNRKLIIILARQHPGETPGSYVCQGFIDYVLSNDKQAAFLRKNYEIVAIPMLNPDGVVVGNYRTNICGLDLNRRWDGGKRKEAQQSDLVKRYITQITKSRQAAFLIDLHGHSRKLFSFFYGNSGLQNPYEVRIFPYICSKISQNRIRFQDSTFICQEQKRRTARIQLGLRLKISNIFTFETSFYGFINKSQQRIHFTINSYRQLGAILCRSVYIHERSKLNPESTEGLIVEKYYNELKNRPDLISRGEKKCSGSQSEPEKAEVAQEDYKKLLKNAQFLKQISPDKKNIKKSEKKEIFMREITKVSRQLHVMDIARVNSIFPNDVLALMPSSYSKKIQQKHQQKKQCKRVKHNISVQTEDIPLIKIYDMCKVQQKLQNNLKKKNVWNKNLSQSINSTKSTQFRTIIRPKSSSNTYLEMNISPKKNQTKQRHESGIQFARKKQKRTTDLGVQTYMTFPPGADFLSKTLDCLMVSPTYKTQLIRKKSNFSTVNTMSILSDAQQNKRSTQSFKIGLKALNVETWRIKKKQFQ